jgi:MoaA/NifB/PqqE/SkfB family radical SAM enzyme
MLCCRLTSIGHYLARVNPAIKRALIGLDNRAALLRHAAAQAAPWVIHPQVRNLTVAITANCNLRCIGCRYGRDFMSGHQLPWSIVKPLLEDARRLGIFSVRLYGGEPLLHPELPRFIRYACDLGLSPYVTTNGVLLRERIDQLYEAGLRSLTIGFYGTGTAYNRYVQRPNRFAAFTEGIAAVRDRYGQAVKMQLNWLLMRSTCSVSALNSAFDFAKKYAMSMQVDLIHYSLPYFTEGPDRELQFRPSDADAIRLVVRKLLELKRACPEVISHSEMGIRSIPDWLLKGSQMRVPCDKYQMIWIGADGTVQLCYVTFKLGNLYEHRLSELLYGGEHRQAARDCFALKCPNCHCGADSRVQKHFRSRLTYSDDSILETTISEADGLGDTGLSIPWLDSGDIVQISTVGSTGINEPSYRTNDDLES